MARQKYLLDKKMNKRIIVISVLLIIISITYIFFIFSRNDILIQKNIHNYLFENSNYITKKKCYIDFIGLSIDGSVFDFYEYDIESKDKIEITDNYPKYEKIFSNEKIINLEFSYWKQTPIPNFDSLFYFQMLQFSNLKKKECSSKFLKKKYLEKKGNFYSYVGGYPIGSYIFIYVPDDKKLFVVYKK